jgi:hypothetical protein
MDIELIIIGISLIVLFLIGIWLKITNNSKDIKDGPVIKRHLCVDKVSGKPKRHKACERPCSSIKNDTITVSAIVNPEVKIEKENCNAIKFPISTAEKRCNANLDCIWNNSILTCDNKIKKLDSDKCESITNRMQCTNSYTCDWIVNESENDEENGYCYTPIDFKDFEMQETVTKVLDLKELRGNKDCVKFCNDCTYMTIDGKWKEE